MIGQMIALRIGLSSDTALRRTSAFLFLLATTLLAAAAQEGDSVGKKSAPAQQPSGSYERTFTQPKSAVEKALKDLLPSMHGRLPVLEGFASPGEHPLSQYQRAYYQASVQVSSTASGGSVVRVHAEVTAWYEDPTPSHSGYRVLTSNGRLESDLLDQLSDRLGVSSAANTSSSGLSSMSFPSVAHATKPAEQPPAAGKDAADKAATEPSISAPMPQLPQAGRTLSSSLAQGLPAAKPADVKSSPGDADKSKADDASLREEAASLEEVLKNQAHPRNLVAIKKNGTPVVSSPSLSAKTLFLASAHDEFEMLDFNQDWVHVRISGLSRGWIWRTSLEMPEGISDVPTTNANGTPVAADLFQVTREETAPFPGDWTPLRGKNVKIISVQKIQEDERNSGAQAKLEYAKSLLDKNYAELAGKSQELAGVVLIFDSIDGGMIAVTSPTVQQWKAGRLNDAALWHHCYFDPPETFTVSTPTSNP